MKEISLSKGFITIIDDEDFERVSQLNWAVHDYGIFQYAQRSQRVGPRSENKQISFLLHRFIMDAKPGSYVDHINGNGLDNQKINLRICSNLENSQSRQGLATRSKGSKYKGVIKWVGVTKTSWRARIVIDKVGKGLGTFKTEKEAAEAYNRQAKKHFGEFALLNDIKEEEEPIPNIIGKRYGKLVVKEYLDYSQRAGFRFMCDCDCGESTPAYHFILEERFRTSCGCFVKLPHGLSAIRHLFRRYKKGAKERDLVFELTEPLFSSLIKKNCTYCNRPPFCLVKSRDIKYDFLYTGVDRVNNNLGYTVENSVPCCMNCNSQKKDQPLENFLKNLTIDE